MRGSPRSSLSHISQRKQRGTTAASTALLVGLVSIVALVAITQAGGGVNGLFTDVADTLDETALNADQAVPAPSASPSPEVSPSPVFAATCGVLLAQGQTSDGTYQIDPDQDGNSPLTVHCDMSGGGWTYASAGVEFEFGYTGGEQSLTTAAVTAEYQFTAYGAQGGLGYAGTHGGEGGIATGRKTFSPATPLYIHVGGQGDAGGQADTGDAGTRLGGYNGGGTGTRGGSGGGGGTDLRTVSGPALDSAGLSSRLLVAGGGGGCGYNSCTYAGGTGGGTNGGNAAANSPRLSRGGTQTGTQNGTNSGGSVVPNNGGFGIGSSYTQANDEGGGGGGWYGGSTSGSNTPGAGGSGYTGGMDSATSMSNGGRSGNGRMTYIFR